jgi:hypothetical protein
MASELTHRGLPNSDFIINGIMKKLEVLELLLGVYNLFFSSTVLVPAGGSSTGG